MTCQSCGRHLQHTDRFCGSCGREVVRDTAEGMPITQFWDQQGSSPDGSPAEVPPDRERYAAPAPSDDPTPTPREPVPAQGTAREADTARIAAPAATTDPAPTPREPMAAPVPAQEAAAPPTQPIRTGPPRTQPVPTPPASRPAQPRPPVHEAAAAGAFPAGSAWASQHEQQRRTGGGARWLIPLLALLLAIPLVWFAVSRSTSDTAAPSVTSTGASPSATSSSPSSVPTSSAPTSSTSSSATSLKDRIAARTPISVSVVKSCENGSGPLSGVGTGSPGTSCPFASSVAKGYRAAVDGPSASDPVRLSGVRSPVTGKEYSMTCSGIAPVRCTGGNNAVVLIYGSEDLPR